MCFKKKQSLQAFVKGTFRKHTRTHVFRNDFKLCIYLTFEFKQFVALVIARRDGWQE